MGKGIKVGEWLGIGKREGISKSRTRGRGELQEISGMGMGTGMTKGDGCRGGDKVIVFKISAVALWGGIWKGGADLILITKVMHDLKQTRLLALA